MGSVLRTMNEGVQLLVIVLMIVGMEVEVISNPFPSEFIFSQVYALLDPQEADLDSPEDGPDSSEENAAEGGPVAADALAAEFETVMEIDETVAIRPQIVTPPPVRAYATATTEFPSLAGDGRALAPSPPISRLLAPPQLCRFLC